MKFSGTDPARLKRLQGLKGFPTPIPGCWMIQKIIPTYPLLPDRAESVVKTMTQNAWAMMKKGMPSAGGRE